MGMTDDLKERLRPSGAEMIHAMPDDELVAEARRVLRDELGIEGVDAMSRQEVTRLARKMLKEDGVVTPP